MRSRYRCIISDALWTVIVGMMTVIIVGSVDGAHNGCYFGSRDDASGH